MRQMRQLLTALIIALLLTFAMGCGKQPESKHLKEMEKGGESLRKAAEENLKLEEKEVVEGKVPKLEDRELEEEKEEKVDMNNILESIEDFSEMSRKGFGADEEGLIDEEPPGLGNGGF